MNKINFKIKKGKIDSSLLMINPHKHWMFLIHYFLIVAICVIIFSMFLFFQIRSEKVFEVIPTPQTRVGLTKEKALNTVIDLFNKKEEKTIQIKTEPVKYRDPSL